MVLFLIHSKQPSFVCVFAGAFLRFIMAVAQLRFQRRLKEICIVVVRFLSSTHQVKTILIKNLSDLLFLPFSFIYKVMYAHTLTYSQYTQTNIMCKKGIISSARIATQDSQSFNRILFRLHLFSPKTTFTILVFHHCTLISLVTRVIMQTHHINNIVAFNRLPVVLQVQLCVFAVTKKVHWFS